MRSTFDCACAHLVARRVHRHGSLAVFLGHLLLLPSILALALGSMGVVAPRGPARAAPEERVPALVALGVPPVLAETAARRPLTEAEHAALTAEQRRLVLRSQMEGATRSTALAMDGAASALSLAALLGACGGGWLLRKRTVRACAHCGAAATTV